MTDPTKDQIAAAVCTPIRDLRDDVWVRVYAAEFARLGTTESAHVLRDCAVEAAMLADCAVEHMPVPAHRRAEVGL